MIRTTKRRHFGKGLLTFYYIFPFHVHQREVHQLCTLCIFGARASSRRWNNNRQSETPRCQPYCSTSLLPQQSQKFYQALWEIFILYDIVNFLLFNLNLNIDNDIFLNLNVLYVLNVFVSLGMSAGQTSDLCLHPIPMDLLL